jgi:hypothetical protein
MVLVTNTLALIFIVLLTVEVLLELAVPGCWRLGALQPNNSPHSNRIRVIRSGRRFRDRLK